MLLKPNHKKQILFSSWYMPKKLDSHLTKFYMLLKPNHKKHAYLFVYTLYCNVSTENTVQLDWVRSAHGGSYMLLKNWPRNKYWYVLLDNAKESKLSFGHKFDMPPLKTYNIIHNRTCKYLFSSTHW